MLPVCYALWLCSPFSVVLRFSSVSVVCAVLSLRYIYIHVLSSLCYTQCRCAVSSLCSALCNSTPSLCCALCKCALLTGQNVLCCMQIFCTLSKHCCVNVLESPCSVLCGRAINSMQCHLCAGLCCHECCFIRCCCVSVVMEEWEMRG